MRQITFVSELSVARRVESGVPKLLRFVAAYTRKLLTRVGEAILVIDYGLMWNCRPETPALRQEYRDQNLTIKAFINPQFMPNSRLSPHKHHS